MRECHKEGPGGLNRKKMVKDTSVQNFKRTDNLHTRVTYPKKACQIAHAEALWCFRQLSDWWPRGTS